MNAIKLSVVKSATPLTALMQWVVGLNKNGRFRNHSFRCQAADLLSEHGFLCDEYRTMIACRTKVIANARLYCDGNLLLNIGSRVISGPMSPGDTLIQHMMQYASSEYIYVSEIVEFGENLQVVLSVVVPYLNHKDS